MYLALLESILRYGVVLWGAASLTNLEKIKKQQIRALKNVMKYKNASTFTVNAFQDLKFLNVFGIYKQKIIIKNQHTNCYKKKISHQHETRRQVEGLFKVPKSCNKYGDSTAKVIVPKLFNLLPKSLLEISSKSVFKRKVTEWVLASTN